MDYLRQSAQQQRYRDNYIRSLNTPPGPPTQQGIYASPEWTGQPYPSIDWQEISQNQPPPNGWPRPPRFNDPGDVPGPPVQFGPPITNDNVRAGYGFVPNGVEEKNLYYYHPDHLGSSSYITDKEGKVIQHTEYMAFGEVLFDEHLVSPKQSYLFNGKELDMETGLYYYGARYYDPKVSLWLNVDPLAEKYPYISPYTYAANNPIKYVDPDGRDFGIRINHGDKTIIIEANYYYKDQQSYDNNVGALSQWNNLNGKYVTKDGVEYKVGFNLVGIVADQSQSVQNIASQDPIGNSIQELSDDGYRNWYLAKTNGNVDRTQEHLENQGGGATVMGKYIANRKSVANDKTRAHEIGHTFGLGENVGGVMDYSESFEGMKNANFSNMKSIIKGVFNQHKSDKHSLNNNGTTKTGKIGNANYQIHVEDNYFGSEGFLKDRKLNEK